MQTVTRRVDLVSELLDVGGDRSLQRRRQHLSGTVANNRNQQRTANTANILARMIPDPELR